MIRFDEKNHKYYYNNKELIPVSEYIRQRYLVLLEKPKDSESLKDGRDVHKSIEKFLKGEESELIPSFRSFISTVKDFIRINNKDVLIEKIVFDLEKGVAGTFDFLDTKKLTLIDWKTTNKSKITLKNFYKKFLEYFSNSNYEKLNHYLFSYIIQQKLYEELIEKTLGLKVKEKYLVFLNKFNNEFFMLKLNNIEKKLGENFLEELKKMKEEWQKNNSLRKFL